eukprot:c20133_g1_i3.p1 GENE.c20133_g1_i3~~c20133_g1_i3.p1  ORF type:complete len:528 (+),score=160.01 c20133_g1_i3:112-1695(+)
MVKVPTRSQLQAIINLLREFDYKDTEESLILDIANHNHQHIIPSIFGDTKEELEEGELEEYEQINTEIKVELVQKLLSEEGTEELTEEIQQAELQPAYIDYESISTPYTRSGEDEWENNYDLGYERYFVDEETFFKLRVTDLTRIGNSIQNTVHQQPEKVYPSNPKKASEPENTNKKDELQNFREQHEVFYLKVYHRKLHTGFEDTKDFPIKQNDIVAGRYQIVGYIGSAAFSKAVQCIDLVTGESLCLKIIKNNKDYFDQSLDEVKLIKYINSNDPDDSHHVLHMYDFFYYREHLFIVCELLRENLYEFSKFNRESEDEPYFTLSRLQKITYQCLKALDFIHSIDLIHCDVKPENILIQSYSKCIVRLIDFGSSCFINDQLSSYVQSRSYRAPEVILGLKYDGRIDIWSIGCVLAELYTGYVLFQSDCVQGLLARIIGMFGDFNANMLAEGKHVGDFFTQEGLLYRKLDDLRYEIIRPKSTTLEARLQSNDLDFVDFIRYLLIVDPTQRPTAAEAIKHKWMTKKYE